MKLTLFSYQIKGIIFCLHFKLLLLQCRRAHGSQRIHSSYRETSLFGSHCKVKSGGSLAQINYINAWSRSETFIFPECMICVSHVFSLIFRGNGDRDSPVCLDVDVIVMFQQQWGHLSKLHNIYNLNPLSLSTTAVAALKYLSPLIIASY